MMEKHAREYLLDIPLWTKKKNTLDQVRDFLRELGDPDEGMKLIHVAGTNGKGSVCADLTAILMEAGYHVGTFVSPHLVDVKERFLYDGKPVTEEELERGFAKVHGTVKEMTGRGYCHPTFFEFAFLMAMVIYQEKRPDFVVLETGLGGRLDTTNVIRRPLACVITSISLDHTQYLGETIPEIAAEKAGIIKPGALLVYDGNDPAASEVIRRRAEEIGVEQAAVGWADVPDFLRQVPFAAAWQAMDAALAAVTVLKLSIPGADQDAVVRGLFKVRWPGRMQQIRPGIWLDGAHNPGGIAAFIQAVKAQETAAGTTESQTGQKETERAGNPGGLQLLFAAVADKDYRQMIRMLCEGLSISRVTVVQLNSERAANPKVLADCFAEGGCPAAEQYGTVPEALQAALRHKGETDRLYAVGSLYLIGEIEAELAAEETRGGDKDA